MLLFVKKRFADALADGSKQFELRADVPRYRNVSEGHILSVNGRQYYRVVEVLRFSTAQAAADELTPAACGFESADELCDVWQSLYPESPGLLAWRLERYAKV
ncbi:ASCH domain-containing protein [Alicyclobacillus sp. ALC3]|uniref:ASCH domain-containing protein n=1 Tax=Alicyclobacillus sp. ALC3 TaxID=2796143 RepID=UPI00237805A1|nr:ASCH domain-containing protein [Alicyclobacillus sp. ALC3]WDL98139.1 ASCH domain-containing protein [Alicyclobacillus sp. ALC3]